MADSKVADLTEDTGPLATDLAYVVHDPSGTPADRKVKLRNLVRGLVADQGAWAASTSYHTGDIVTYGGYRFLRTGADFTSGSTFDPANWTALQDANAYDNPASWSAANAADYEFEASSSSLPSGWSWFNQGSSTYTEGNGVGSVLVPVTSSQWRGITRAVPAGTSWTAVFKMSAVLVPNGTNAFIGTFLSDGTKMFIHRLTAISAAATGTVKYDTSGLSGGANISSSYGILSFQTFFYMRIKKNNATSYDFGFSPDGVGWTTIDAARDVTATLTPTIVGFGFNNDTGLSQPVSCQWVRFR